MSAPKDKGGRPTTYTEEMIDKSLEYLEVYGTLEELIPTVVGLCRYIKRSKSIVYDWAKDPEKEKFSDILCQIEELQHIKLVNGGLSSAFNPAITKMMLTKHGYSDKQEIDHQSSDQSMSPKGFNDFYNTTEPESES